MIRDLYMPLTDDVTQKRGTREFSTTPRAEHAVRSRGIRAYHKQARQAAEHAQSRTGVSRCGHCLGYRLTVTAQTPSLVTDAKEEFVIPRLRASTALAAGCKKLAPQALCKFAMIRALYMPTRPTGRFGMSLHFGGYLFLAGGVVLKFGGVFEEVLVKHLGDVKVVAGGFAVATLAG